MKKCNFKRLYKKVLRERNEKAAKEVINVIADRRCKDCIHFELEKLAPGTWATRLDTRCDANIKKHIEEDTEACWNFGAK